MIQATGTNLGTAQNKRVRFDDDGARVPRSHHDPALTAKSPKAAAEVYLQSAHPASHQDDILKKSLHLAGTRYLQQAIHAYNSIKSYKKLTESDDTFVPRSARVKIDISVPKNVENAPAVATARAELQELVKKFQSDVKSKFAKAHWP